MRLTELESVEVRNDLPGALQRAIVEVPALEEIHRRAEDRAARADEDRQRLQSRFAALNREIKTTADRTRDLKKAWLESMIDGAENLGAHKEYSKAKARKLDLVDALNFLATYSQNDNGREALLAAIEEREAKANVLEATAARQRLGVIAGAASAFQFDPAATVSFPEDAWSSRAIQEALDIRNVQIVSLKKRLVEHDELVLKHRNMIAQELFS